MFSKIQSFKVTLFSEQRSALGPFNGGAEWDILQHTQATEGDVS